MEHSKFRKKKETVRKYYAKWLIDLANKFHYTEKFLISFMSYIIKNCFFFYWEILWTNSLNKNQFNSLYIINMLSSLNIFGRKSVLRDKK